VAAGSLGVAGLPSVEARAAAPGRISGTVDPSLTRNAEAVVYIDEVPDKTFEPPTEPAVIEQRQMAFVPHVLPILRGTTVRFPNVDRVRHNVFSPSPAKPFNFGIYYPRESRQITFDKVGVVSLLCNIHETMSGYILVLQNPYFARVGADGKYAIGDVPDGSYTLALWAERGKPLRVPAVVRGGPVEVNFTK